LNFFLFIVGILLFVIPLLIGGVEQGTKLSDASVAFADANLVAINFLRISATGQLLILLGALCLLLNILAMTIQWKLGLAKCVIASVTAPLETEEVKS